MLPVTFPSDPSSATSSANDDNELFTPAHVSTSAPQQDSPYLISPGPPTEAYPLPSGDESAQLLESFQDTLVLPNKLFGTERAKSGNAEAQWPFSDYQTAALMRYYVNELARWFDHSDSHRHFATVVPELACKSPPLLNAILAFASKHLSLMGKLDSSVTLRYQDACFKALLPELQEKAFEGERLAAVIILRLVVQMAG